MDSRPVRRRAIEEEGIAEPGNVGFEDLEGNITQNCFF